MNEWIKISEAAFENLFKTTSLSIKQGDVIGVIGKNGSGKSTLLNLIANRLHWSNGHVQYYKEISISYVEQDTDKFDIQNYDTLSGGEKLIVRLTKGFEARVNLLLLDEPTNHLDESHQRWLVKRIKAYQGAMIVVSHDRHFLDDIATKIWSIEDGKVYEQVGNYSHYMEVRSNRRKTQQAAYDKQQKKIEQVEKEIAQLSSWSHKAHKDSTKHEFNKEYYRLAAKRMDKQIKAKRKQLEKQLEENSIEKLKDEYKVTFDLPKSKKRGKRMVQLKNVSKCYGNLSLFKAVNLSFQFGDKIALVGQNGSGKTTLLKMLMQEEIYEGDIWRSPSLKIGYLTQSVFDLPLELSPSNYFYKETFDARGKVQNLMRHLGFSMEQWEQPFSTMSMGERVKCKLMQFILEEKELLILDEPTNHLDLPSREQLEETLQAYNGSLIVVSHDRYFREKVTEKTLEINDGEITIPKNVPEMEDTVLKRLQLENQKQEILGKLSYLTSKDREYEDLDKQFIEIIQQLKSL